MATEMIEGLPAIHQAGDYRVLGCLPPEPRYRSIFPTYKGSAYPVLKPDQWREVDYRPFRAGPTKDQKTTSSCTGHATSTVFAYHRVLDGMPGRPLSASFPYAHVNGGKDQGASVSAIQAVLQQVGDCPEELCPLSSLFMNQISAAAVAAAADYRVDQAYRVRSFAEFCSALTLFGPCPFGIMIGHNFGQLDRNGVCPQIDMTLGGHALAGVGLKLINGGWHILFENSWTASWGIDGGFAYVNEGHFRQMTDGFALVIARPSDQPDDGDEPPVAHLKLAELEDRGPSSVSVPAEPPREPEDLPVPCLAGDDWKEKTFAETSATVNSGVTREGDSETVPARPALAEADGQAATGPRQDRFDEDDHELPEELGEADVGLKGSPAELQLDERFGRIFEGPLAASAAAEPAAAESTPNTPTAPPAASVPSQPGKQRKGNKRN